MSAENQEIEIPQIALIFAEIKISSASICVICGKPLRQSASSAGNPCVDLRNLREIHPASICVICGKPLRQSASSAGNPCVNLRNLRET